MSCRIGRTGIEERAQPVSALVSNPTWRVVLHGCEFDGDLEVPVGVESILLNPHRMRLTAGVQPHGDPDAGCPHSQQFVGAINARH